MNFKQIDAAIAFYRDSADETTNARLAFFREIWETMGAVSEKHGEAQPYRVPEADALQACARDHVPVFSVSAVAIDREAFAEAVRALADLVARQAAFPDTLAEELTDQPWEQWVAQSPLELAGSDPAGYVEAFACMLELGGLSESSASIGAIAASLSLRALLEAPARSVVEAMRIAGADRAHPLRCPVCGGEPTIARVGETEASQGRGKELWCGQCATAWSFERVRCARCGTQNQSRLHYYNVEGDDSHRIAVCDECEGYVRTVYQQDASAPFSFEVEDVAMAPLDAIANDPQFARVREGA